MVRIPESGVPVSVSAPVECPCCGYIFESFFESSPVVTGSLVGVHLCQECDYEWSEKKSAWVIV